MRVAMILLPLALVGATSLQRDQDVRDQAKLDKALAGLVPGQPTSCVPLSFPTLHTTTIGRTILYSDSPGGTVYRNDTAGGCEGAARGDILVQVEHEGRPCSGDIIRTVDNASHFTTGSCALGQFVPYTKVRR